MSGTTWSKFFWSDWETDPALKLCSFAAQGLWMRMLCIASAHDPIGYVAVAGRPLDETAIARMTGGSESEVRDLLGELDRYGVFSRDRQGRIFSRRMVLDAKRAAIARKNGKKGGNPNLGKGEGNNGLDNPQDNLGLKPQEPKATFQTKEDADASFVRPEPNDAFAQAWKAYPAIGRTRSKSQTKTKPLWMAAARSAGGEDRLLAALRRYLAEDTTHKGECGPPGFHKWLTDGRWEHWLSDGVGGGDETAPAPAFDGPPDIRAWAAKNHGEAFAKNYIDPSRWDAGSRTLLAANPFAEGKLRRDLAPICEKWKFTVRLGAANANDPDLFEKGAA